MLAETPSSVPSAESAKDVVLVHGLTEDRRGYKVLRAREDGLELGEVRPLEEGKPLTGDVVRLKPRAESPLLCDVETQVSLRELEGAQVQNRSGDRAAPRVTPAEPRRRVGPAQVATDAYRMNWDAIWKTRRDSGSDLN